MGIKAAIQAPKSAQIVNEQIRPGGKATFDADALAIRSQVGFIAGLFIEHFQKNSRQKNSASKKTQGDFWPKNSMHRDFWGFVKQT